jgi:DNA polymerase-3 subunit epsilon
MNREQAAFGTVEQREMEESQAHEFLLFVDTETTGLPSNWNKPYTAERNWPCVAQLAWLVYTKEGKLVKSENHYLRVPAGSMKPRALAIHGLTPAFLEQHGEDRAAIMQRFYNDLLAYKPLVVGHYMRLDFHMIGAELHRTNLPNALAELSTLCTMQTSQRQAKSVQRNFLRLGELHEQLFQEPMPTQHNAQTDAEATARCFFELRRLGDLNDTIIAAQPQLALPGSDTSLHQQGGLKWPLVLAVAGILSLLLYLLAVWITA